MSRRHLLPRVAGFGIDAETIVARTREAHYAVTADRPKKTATTRWCERLNWGKNRKPGMFELGFRLAPLADLPPQRSNRRVRPWAVIDGTASCSLLRDQCERCHRDFRRNCI